MLTDQQREFAEKNIKLSYLMANKWIKRLPLVEIDEIKSLCHLGLVKACKYYDPAKGYKFSSLASRIMDNEVLMMLRKDKKHHGVLSLYDPIRKQDQKDNKIMLIETIEVNEDPFEEVYIEYINSLVDELPGREKVVFNDTLSNYRNWEIGAKLGISQSYVSRINARAIKRLKMKLGDL